MPESAPIANHKAWRLIDQMRRTLASIAKEDPTVDLQPLPKLADALADQLALADPELVSAASLTNIQQHFAGATSELASYQGDKQQSHLEQAREKLQNAMAIAQTLPLAKTEVVAELNLRSVIDRVQAGAEKSLAALSAKSDAQAQSVDALTNTVQQTMAKQAELASMLDAAKQRTDSIVSEFQKQFSENENSRAKRVESAIEDSKSAFEDLKKNLTDNANALLEELRKRDRETAALAVQMGATGVSTSFQSAANKNERAADLLRLVAIVLLTVLVGVVLHTLWSLSSLQLETSLARLLGALLVGLPAAYVAHESSRQRAEANRSRRIELELTSLGPFIENLSTEEKTAIRKQLVATYFGKAFDKDDKQDESMPIGGTVLDLVKAVGTLAKK